MNQPLTSPSGRPPGEKELPDNIVALGLAEEINNAGELEKRRLVAQRVNEIMLGRLNRDAEGMEASAKTEPDIRKAHSLMDTARCLRVTMTWINGPTEKDKLEEQPA